MSWPDNGPMKTQFHTIHIVNGLSLRRIADSIFNSKVKYGLQLCGKVRTSELHQKQGYLMEIQKIQNKLFRLLNNSTIKDKIPTKNIANDLNMLSVMKVFFLGF